ncbi:hypothetical protein AB1Y20_006624 [Prymnesium parvum]|uniref:Uncharacterized protein n=1 Tax=Prymnesium parvum TaxID=97485 RepID=A0AB34IYX0_PRYPA
MAVSTLSTLRELGLVGDPWPRQGESVLPSVCLADDGSAESATLEVCKVPRHDQAPRAISELGYMEVKRALLERLSRGGKDTELDVLQAAATGLVVRPGQEPCQHWVPLLAKIAEGPVHGVHADLIDPDLTNLSSIARFSWPHLIGRTVALQLTMDKTTLLQNLVGFKLPEVLEATSGDDWSDLDLGGPTARLDEASVSKTRNMW